MFSKAKSKKKQLKMLASQLITVQDPQSIVSEQFKTIRTNINFSMSDKHISTLLITSSTPSEGKSTNSANIAAVFAQAEKKVLLIDSDMRKPTAHHTFAVENTMGLSDLLIRQHTIEEVLQKTTIEGLDIITSGPIPPNPTELLSSEAMDQLIEILNDKYDLVIFDAPSVLSVTDAQILSNKCEGVILVVNTGKTEKDNVVKAKNILLASKANMLGVIMNNFILRKDLNYYKYYNNSENRIN